MKQNLEQPHRSLFHAKPVLLYGLSADPIHRGHLESIEALKQAYPQHLIVVMPCRINPSGKNDAEGNQVIPRSGEQRLQMLQNIQNDPSSPYLKGNLCISSYEIDKSTPSFTIDTLTWLHGFEPKSIILAMGLDSFAGFDTWPGYRDIINAVQKIIVLARPGVTLDLKDKLAQLAIPPSARTKFRKLTGRQINISSTNIRQWIKEGNWEALVPYLEPVTIDNLKTFSTDSGGTTPEI